MSETGASRLGSDSEVDDPGRDPEGIGGPPRDPFGGGSSPSGGNRKSGPSDERDPLMPAEDAEDAADAEGADDDAG